MFLLAPMMLWGGVAAAIPIALHFFFRSRYRTVPWAAMKFLLTAIEQTSRRLRFQELLLLVCRVLVLAVLALALARPLSSIVRGAGGGDAVDAVFVIDTSMSMGTRDGAVTRLERAKTAALDVIEHLPSHSTVQIVTCADRAELIGPRAPGDLSRARELIENIELTSLATDLAPGVAEAAGVLERGQASNKELYLFSDMQKLGWQEQIGDLARTLRDIKEKATIHLVRCGTRTPANVAIVGITPQEKVPRPGERSGFAVQVRNTSAETLKDLKVSLAVDGDDKAAETQTLAQIGPGETRHVPLSVKLEKPGLRVLTARLGHDDLEADNRFDRVVPVREQVNVLIVDGSPNEREPEKASSYFLLHALLPIKEADRAKYFLQPRVVSPKLAAPALLAKQDLCILVNVALQADAKKTHEVLPADFVAEIGRFVRDGHALLIFAGDNVNPAAYNRVLGGKAGLLPLPIKSVIDRPFEDPLLYNRNSVNLPAYELLRPVSGQLRTDNYELLGLIPIWKSLELEEAPSAKKEPQQSEASETENKSDGSVTIALRYASGQPAVVLAKVGAGEVALVTTSADPGYKKGQARPTWTLLSKKEFAAMYVPFLDMTLTHLLQGQTQAYNVVAGQPLDWFPTEKELRSYTLVHSDGFKERLGLPEKHEKKGNRPMVKAANLLKAGIYHMVAAVPNQEKGEENAASKEKTQTPIAVVPDPRESEDLSSFSDEALDAMLGFAPVHMTAGAAHASTSGADRLNREWTTWLLVIVLFLAFGESLLAYWCGRAW